MSEYTKGRWKVIKWNEGCGFNVFSDDGFIASVPPGTGYHPMVEAEANAHLIAASPIGDKLATAVLGANFDDYDDFLELKELAKKFKLKSRGKGGNQ